MVGLSQHVVVYVVGRRNLQAACSELNIHITVLDDGDNASDERHNDFPSLQPLVLRVFRVDAHGRVAHDGFRTCRGNYGIVALRILMDDVPFVFQVFYIFQFFESIHIVFQMKKVALLFAIDNLLGA